MGSFDLPNVHVNISAVVERQKKTDRNVLGLLPPMEGTENPEYVMVGAHYDHIGHGEIDSLAHKGEEGQVHNGADDNASGVSTVLELAASWLRHERKILKTSGAGLFSLSGREKRWGLSGRHISQNILPFPLKISLRISILTWLDA